MRILQESEFESFFLQALPSLDLRAPVEFHEGSIPGAVNRPLLEDLERAEVGTVYKQKGRESAIELGHHIVQGEIKAKRMKQWKDFFQENPSGALFCFRGGLRSQTVAKWLEQEGLDPLLIKGGYKALRRSLMHILESRVPSLKFQVIGGPTGSGKTEWIRSQGQAFLDLEELARHRGSAFGSYEEPQPSQINFENMLALQILRLSQNPGPILVESESRMIGHRCVPAVLFAQIKSSPRQELKVSLEERVERIFHEYILKSRLGLKGDLTRFQDFENSLALISKKLGGLRFQEIATDLKLAQKAFVDSGDLEINRVWIRKLLQWYYDPAYRREL